MEEKKKSKTQIAKSLLQRVSSRTDVHDAENGDGGSEAPPRSSNAASESNASLTSHPSNHSRQLVGSQRSSRHRPHLSTTMSSADNPSGHSPPPPSDPASMSPPSPTASSLEQSVKLFRLFEALRSGDTAAISKAMRQQSEPDPSSLPARVEGTTILHLAIQCAELPVIEFVLSNIVSSPDAVQGINARDRDGNTPLHIGARLGRAPVVKMLLDQDGINDSIANYAGNTPLDLAFTPEIYQMLQLARSMYIDSHLERIHELVAARDYEGLETLLRDPRVQTTLDVNGPELATDPATTEHGGTLLHEAARRRDNKLIQLLLLNGADPFRRDRKGKLPQDVTKDEKTRAILKKSPAAVQAQRGIQEKTILGGGATGQTPNEKALDNKEAREMKGYLKKWTNYTSGWKLRWFVLEDGVLSYYKHQDDQEKACRGAINMRIARLDMDPQDKLRFEIQGKSSVKYHLKANHQVEAKRWYWALNNAIQWAKDEKRQEERRQNEENEALQQAKMEQVHKSRTRENDSTSVHSGKSRSMLTPGVALSGPSASANASSSVINEDTPGDTNLYQPSEGGGDLSRLTSQMGATTLEGDMDDDDEFGDENSSHEMQPQSKDAFNITAQSIRLQLDLLAQVSNSLKTEQSRNPSLQMSDPSAVSALAAYESSVGTLKGLIGDLLRISKDRDSYWQYRVDREQNIRRMWEESMAKVAREQEELESRIGESEVKRRRTKRALRDALETIAVEGSTPATPGKGEKDEFIDADEIVGGKVSERRLSVISPTRRRSTFVDLSALSEPDSEDQDEEFFDAVDSGEVEVVEMPVCVSEKPAEKGLQVGDATADAWERKKGDIEPSFIGYEDGVRKKLKLDADNRPKISLWSILKSMIGKDMTKMTLPVTFNEPTSLLQRVAEDMEYTDLLDTAAERLESTERMVYVAAFAASEYASTIGRVAKPFNPLLGETYEYARPDKSYRFFIEQVSHHPPIGAAWAESPKWDYYGESAVKSKFYGKSFDINPLGTWFLRLRHAGGGEELYTWKKVTSSVVGIITGSPTVDNYGIMEIKNWTTGEVCTLDFKKMGWKASTSYQVVGRVADKDGKTRWSIGGRWNDKIYARLTPGFEDSALSPTHPDHQDLAVSGRANTMGSSQAFLVWEASRRPQGIPFNLTPFVVTLNAVTPSLQPYLAPTDTRLRPDQRAMEDGEYDFAATEKNRLEEKQRAKRRWREARGEEFAPRWFSKRRCPTTREQYWQFNFEYWKVRRDVAEGEARWEEQGLEDIFSERGIERVGTSRM